MVELNRYESTKNLRKDKQKQELFMQGKKVERNLSKKGLFAGCPFLSTIY